jgi:hypothetical protein
MLMIGIQDIAPPLQKPARLCLGGSGGRLPFESIECAAQKIGGLG